MDDFAVGRFRVENFTVFSAAKVELRNHVLDVLPLNPGHQQNSALVLIFDTNALLFAVLAVLYILEKGHALD